MKWGAFMQNITSEKAMRSAAASVEMEGFVVTQEYKNWCEKLLNNEITMAQYIELVKISQGV